VDSIRIGVYSVEGIGGWSIKPALHEPPVREEPVDAVGDPLPEVSRRMDLEPGPLEPIGNYFNIVSYYLVTYDYERHVTGRTREQAPLQ
jgi:hypothetical protein